jgi:hypothetical protein
LNAIPKRAAITALVTCMRAASVIIRAEDSCSVSVYVSRSLSPSLSLARSLSSSLSRALCLSLARSLSLVLSLRIHSVVTTLEIFLITFSFSLRSRGVPPSPHSSPAREPDLYGILCSNPHKSGGPWMEREKGVRRLLLAAESALGVCRASNRRSWLE